MIHPQAPRHSVSHSQFGVIHQRLGQRAQVIRGPEQLGFLFHDAGDGQVAHAAHQFRGLFTGVLAGDAGFDAEQRGGLAFALVELGFACSGVGGGFVCCHCLVSLDFSGPGQALSPARLAPTGETQPQVGAGLPANWAGKGLVQCAGICIWINANSSSTRSDSTSCIDAIIRIVAGDLGWASTACCQTRRWQLYMG